MYVWEKISSVFHGFWIYKLRTSFLSASCLLICPSSICLSVYLPTYLEIIQMFITFDLKISLLGFCHKEIIFERQMHDFLLCQKFSRII